MAQITTKPRMRRRRDSAMEATEVVRTRIRAKLRAIKDELDFTVLGVCSGNGLNKLECALVRYQQASPNAPLRVELLQFSEIAVSPTVRTPIFNLLHEVQNMPSEAPRLNKLLGLMFSSGIKTFCQNHKIVTASIDLVSTHAPTLRRLRRFAMDNPSTHPLGWNAVITAETGITVVFDFAVIESGVPRPHIAPVAFVDRLFLRHPSKFRACLNIDELANFSFIPALVDSSTCATVSRDCGPGSLFIDYAMRYCTSNDHSEDHDGRFAAQGKVNQSIVDCFLETHDYLRTTPPLSIAQEMFGDHEAQRLIDECLFLSMSDVNTVATITRITAQNILKQYRRILQHFFLPSQKVDELFICGPSARNSNIIDYLEAELPESVITKPLHDIGISGDAHRAVCYAHLALEAVLGQATRPSTPSMPVFPRSGNEEVIGTIVRGVKWEELSNRVLQFSKGKPLHVTKDVRVVGSLETAINGLGLQ